MLNSPSLFTFLCIDHYCLKHYRIQTFKQTKMSNTKWIGPLTWAYVIIVGGIMFTPEGGNPIVTNTTLQAVVGAIGIVLGAIGIAQKYRQTQAQAGRTQNPLAPSDIIVVAASTAAILIGAQYLVSSLLAQSSGTMIIGALLVLTGMAGFVSLRSKKVQA